MSKTTCAECGAPLTGDMQRCPACGAENPNWGKGTPETIEELKAFCTRNEMPLVKMRFFIDVDYQSPRAFGIYRDGDNVVVYKNKADGSRAVRYHGPDEAYAVRELYQKLLDECHNRGIYPGGGRPQPARQSQSTMSSYSRGCLTKIVIFLAVFFCLIFFLVIRDGHKDDGYYRYAGTQSYYYRYGDNYYHYSDDGDWDIFYTDADFLGDNYMYEYMGDDYSPDWEFSDVHESENWDGSYLGSLDTNSSSYSHSYDDDDDTSYYDYDDWDSSDTDWDSDW